MVNISLILLLVLVSVASYFIGNISPAILIGRAHGIDIKKEGSGNAGTTNVLRVLGKKAALCTLLIDIGKGALAVELGRLAGYFYTARMSAFSTYTDEVNFVIMNFAYICGLMAFIGHIWPMTFGFKGGKGVATAFGVLVTINPAMGFACLGVVAVVVLIGRMVSLGSICGAVSLPFLAYWLEPDFVFVGCIMAIIVIVKHRSNIKRILKGEESKLFGNKGKITK